CAIHPVSKFGGILSGYISRFALELYSFKLGLCTYGFAQHSQYGRTYSYWPIILTLYNLLLEICTKSKYMLLTMVIHDPSNPKCLVDLYLEPLIEELLQLWHMGVRMHHEPDIHDVCDLDIGSKRSTRLWDDVQMEYYGYYGVSNLYG
ncbi:UNVERIFIED_CONTAM: hypothetical protein Sradi_3160200, partial [Sesamum radiatum]